MKLHVSLILMQKRIDLVHAAFWVFLLLSAGLVISFSPLSRDGDLWLHAASGRWFIQNWQRFTLWFEDPYLISGGPNEVFNWLTQVVLYLILEIVGPVGVRLWAFVIVGGSLLLIFNRYRQSDPAMPVVLSTMVWSSLYSSFDFRPQLVTVFFLTLYALYFFESLDRIPKLAWVLFANVFWLNFHGSGVVGVLWSSGFYLLIYFRYKQGRLFLSALACLTCAVLTPNHVYLFERIVALRQAATTSGIVEWGAPSDFFRTLLVLFALLVLLTRSLSIYQKVFGLGFLLLSALYVRNQIFLLVPICWVFPFVFERCNRASRQLVPLLVLFLLFVIQPFWLHAPTHLPIHATGFLKAIGFKGTLLNYPSWGGYLNYALFPSAKTAADNRAYTSRSVLSSMRQMSEGQSLVDLGKIAANLNFPEGVLFPSQVNLRPSLGDAYVTVFENNVATLMLHRSQGVLLESAKLLYARHNVPFSPEVGFVFKDAARSAPRWISEQMEALEISAFAEASWVERDASNEFTFLHTRGMLKQGS